MASKIDQIIEERWDALLNKKEIVRDIKCRLASSDWQANPDMYMRAWSFQARPTATGASLHEDIKMAIMSHFFDLRLVGRYPKD